MIFLILQNPTSFIGYMNISEKVTLEADDVLQILDFSEFSNFSEVSEFLEVFEFFFVFGSF
jgi:hypothetical protein